MVHQVDRAIAGPEFTIAWCHQVDRAILLEMIQTIQTIRKTETIHNLNYV